MRIRFPILAARSLQLSSAVIMGAAIFAFVSSAERMMQPIRLVNQHTAGVLPRANYSFETRIFASGDSAIPGNGLCAGIAVGITDRLNIGISYGGDGIIGRGPARPNPYPGAFIKYRIVEENYILPAMALGYDHQGSGGIQNGDYKGFVYKSPGFFFSLSKSYLLFQTVQLGFHGGVNYSLEELNKVKWPDCFAGLDLNINEELALAGEYDFALNVRDPDSRDYLHPLRGFLNAGIRWAFTPQFHLEFLAIDILQMRVNDNNRRLGWSRELRFTYINQF